MAKNKQTTEEQILKAAEEVFLSKGFKDAKTSEIAELAGTNNALINYYFRSKEKLFNKVLHGRIKLLAQSIVHIADQDRPFFEMVKDFIETQFQFFKDNEMLPRFILSEVLPYESRVILFKEHIIPVILQASTQLDKKLRKEITAGRIRNITMIDLLYMISALNVFCFVVKPIVMQVGIDYATAQFSQILDERKNKNVEIVMSYLKNISNP